MRMLLIGVTLLATLNVVPVKAAEIGYFFGSSKTFKIDIDKNTVIETKPTVTNLPLDLPRSTVTISGNIISVIETGQSYSLVVMKPDGTIAKVLFSNISSQYTGFPKLFLQPKGNNLLLQYKDQGGAVKAIIVEVPTGKITEVAVFNPRTDKLLGFSSNGQKYYSLEVGDCVALKSVDVVTSVSGSRACLQGVDSKDPMDFKYFDNDRFMVFTTGPTKTTKARLFDAVTATLLATVDLGVLDVNDAFVDNATVIMSKAAVTPLDPDGVTVDFIPQGSIVKYDVGTGQQVGALAIENDQYLKFLGMNTTFKKLYVLVKSVTTDSFDMVIVDTDKFTIAGRIADVGSGIGIVFVQEP